MLEKAGVIHRRNEEVLLQELSDSHGAICQSDHCKRDPQHILHKVNNQFNKRRHICCTTEFLKMEIFQHDPYKL